MARYVELIGVIAAILQAVGYVLYIIDSIKNRIRPNGATWLMFAYGTALLTVLEWDNHASLALLGLPATCAVMGIFVAILCAKRGALQWPKAWDDVWEIRAFKSDLVLTALYFTAWLLTGMMLLNEIQRSLAALVFLWGSNGTTFTAFVPMLKSTYQEPHRERPRAWILWSCAYFLLGVATVLEQGWWTVLLVYPASNAVLHGVIAWLSSQRRVHRPHAAE